METNQGFSDMNLKQIEKLSPVEIEYKDNLYVDGLYDAGIKRIKIDKKLCGNNKIETLLHEIGHAIHDKNGCKCIYTRNHPLGEYHAYRFVMKFVKDNLVLVDVFVEDVIEGFNSFSQAHNIAAKRIMKLKGWKKLNRVV